NTWAGCDAEAKGLAQGLSGKLESAWKRFVAGLMADTASFGTFRQVASCAGTLRKVDELNAELKSRALALPQTRKEIAEAVAIGAQAKALIDGLNLGGVPAEVQELLKDAANGRAKLSDLSDKTLKWLKENKQFIAGLRITASSQ
ncbi:MAG: hypothetical protein PSW75_07530, partial [bacterium]|nr:hypothetical protein [bacterium]